MMMLSAVIITKNEAKSIARCLTSLSFADETVVVDDFSSDETAALAQTLGARVYQQKWLGYGQQKNFGAAQAKGEWLLFIDADEEVTPELQREILAITENSEPAFNIYWLRLVTIFLHKPLRHLYGHNPRLFRREAAQWDGRRVHEQLVRKNGQRVRLGGGETGLIKEPLLHYSHETVKAYRQKMHYYTGLEAEEMAKTNRHRSGRRIQPTVWLGVWLGMRQTLKMMFYRRGALDGYAGWVWCVLSGYYELEAIKKYIRIVSNYKR